MNDSGNFRFRTRVAPPFFRQSLVASLLTILATSCTTPTTQPQGSVRLVVTHPNAAKVGDGVTFGVRVTNVGELERVLNFSGSTPDSPDLDVVVSSSSTNTPLWHSLKSPSIILISHARTLEPGSDWLLNVRWDGRDDAGAIVPAGVYRVTASLRGSAVGDVAESSDSLKAPPTVLTIAK